MMPVRSGIVRSITIALVVLAVTACGSGAATPAPATDAPPTSAVPTVTSAPATETVAAATTTATVATAPSGGTGDCPAGLTSGHAKYAISGFEAWHFCGPATATVTLGGVTAHISGGSCTVPAAGLYSVSIGTEVFGDPPASVEPDDLIIYIASADGLTDPGGVVNHTGWLIVGASITFGPNKMSGTFSGTTINPGTNVSGSFTCQ